MCQVHVIKRENWEVNQNLYEGHLNHSAMINDHGSSAVFIDENGEHSIIRAMDFDIILDMMVINTKWQTVVIHHRYTTQGASTLANTHMWQVGSFLYCHNGVLSHPDTINYEVDSQIIGAFLEEGNVWDAISYCQSEEYANVIIINLDDHKLWVTRSKDNTLYTDGNGQFSTSLLFGEIDELVPKNTVLTFDLDIVDFEPYQYYPSAYEMTYEEKVYSSTHGATTPVNESELAETFDEIVEESRQDIMDKIFKAEADGDKLAINRYNYLLEKAEGNG